MPYCEFLIKSAGFKRMTIDKWRHTRKIAYFCYLSSPNLDHNKAAKNEEAFMSLDDDYDNKQSKSRVDEWSLNQFMKESEEYWSARSKIN